ncbi:hypothetical protein QFZ27_005798 [Inquilinus ginsengisoli]|uniref:hypothetical protein n=1 Tax=Inquilinus ginsengisoli TaxID=363840 RepID=UPI003D24D71B
MSGLDLKGVANQKLVISCLSEAEKEVRVGLGGLNSWKAFESLASALDAAKKTAIADAIAVARRAGYEATALLQSSISDSRFRLKAIAARWHAEHAAGPIVSCPLCEASLGKALVEQLESLRSAGDAAARTFDDNVTAIAAALDAALPAIVKQMTPEFITSEPRSKLIDEINKRFLQNDSYSKCLVRLGELVEEAIAGAPTDELPDTLVDASDLRLKPITDRIVIMERAVVISEWFESHCAAWRDWWADASDDNAILASEEDDQKHETLLEHLKRLSDALSKAEPYRKAVEALGIAWKAGKEAHDYENEIAKRVEIGKSLTPLKMLGALCEFVAGQAIGDLSGRVGELLDEFLVAERLNYKGAQLQKKSGLVVHAGLSGEICIDATLIANSSWLRAVLWCFIFAMREEAVEQIGMDEMPLVAFDDPQGTFDTYHRARWARYVASLQNSPVNVQVLLTTYEEMFLDLISFDGMTGRRALIAAPGPDRDCAVVLEGASLDRRWQKALIEKTPVAAVDYLDRARVYVEGMLKLMMRGEAPGVPGMVLGVLRSLLENLNGAGKAPWKAPVFKTLVELMGKQRAEVKYLEGSHHTTGQNFGMAEATIVEQYLRSKLGPALARAYETAREHRLLHGGMKALHAALPTAVLPEGYRTKVSEIPLTLLGRAAARTDGRDADGLVDMSEFQQHERLSVILNDHSAFRLVARTLEPVAKVGDILLTKSVGEPSNRSLVVALNNDRILARRFEISENQEDIAVLVAQAINPRQIAPPIVALKTTFSLHKIVGIIFDRSKPYIGSSAEHEIRDCGGEAAIAALTAGVLGLVEVVGKSAEPIALDHQYLVVRDAISPSAACTSLRDQPVIAEDADGNCYFKRMRIASSDQVVLESLEGSGDFPPTILDIGGTSGRALAKVWPVAGVLFELPV